MHEKAPYYFDELIILEKDIEEFRINGPRSYSLCKELPRNYTSSCKTGRYFFKTAILYLFGLSETLKEYKEEHDKCTSWHITVFLMLERHRAKEKDIDEIQVLLRNIMNNCSTEQNMYEFFYNENWETERSAIGGGGVKKKRHVSARKREEGNL